MSRVELLPKNAPSESPASFTFCLISCCRHYLLPWRLWGCLSSLLEFLPILQHLFFISFHGISHILIYSKSFVSLQSLFLSFSIILLYCRLTSFSNYLKKFQRCSCGVQLKAALRRILSFLACKQIVGD